VTAHASEDAELAGMTRAALAVVLGAATQDMPGGCRLLQLWRGRVAVGVLLTLGLATLAFAAAPRVVAPRRTAPHSPGATPDLSP
jgi:hypothetical protein